jgi:hypothetical protein
LVKSVIKKKIGILIISGFNKFTELASMPPNVVLDPREAFLSGIQIGRVWG